MNIFRLIKKSKFFYNFDDKEINQIFDHIGGRIVKYSRGTVVAAQGTPTSEIGVLLSGNMLKFVTKQDGTKEALGKMEAGESFGEVAVFLQDTELQFSCVAAEEVAVLFLSPATILSFSDKNSPAHQKLLSNILRILADQIAEKSKDSEYLIIKSMRLKIAKLVYDKYLEQGTLHVELGLNRNEMADYLNVSRPSMSREMMRMRDEGMFDFWKDKIDIKDLDTLKNIATKA